MDAVLEQFAHIGVAFELVDGDRIKASGRLTDDARSAIRTEKDRIVAALKRQQADDRRSCAQCDQLSPDGQCQAAWRGEALGFPTLRTYYPIADIPQHCAGFVPIADDPDQRPGSERWPTLLLNRVAA